MAYYERSDSYYDYDDYRGDSRRNSNSFSEEINGAKRKKSNWGGGGRGRGGGSRQFSRGGGKRNASPRNITIDTPLFLEPKRTPPSARRIPQSPVEGRKRGRDRNNSFRSNTKSYFDLKDMPNLVEPEHSGPSWHWDNYVQGCKSWQDKHKLAYYQSRCTALEFENQMLFEQINQLIKENIVFAAERGITPTMEVPEIPGSAQKENQASSNKKQGKSSNAPSAGSDIEFNLTEDVVQYLETNIRHKLTLKKEKLEKEKGTAAAKSGKTDTNVKGTDKNVGPKRTAQKRKDELEQLYGENATLIQGLETSLQLNFNRNCDTFKPEVYPSAPLNSETVDA